MEVISPSQIKCVLTLISCNVEYMDVDVNCFVADEHCSCFSEKVAQGRP